MFKPKLGDIYIGYEPNRVVLILTVPEDISKQTITVLLYNQSKNTSRCISIRDTYFFDIFSS